MNKAIEHWDDERSQGNGIIVMLRHGWSFEGCQHEGVRGFDTITEARDATRIKALYRCDCAECNANARQGS